MFWRIAPFDNRVVARALLPRLHERRAVWSRVIPETSAAVPTARYSHQAVVLDNGFVVYGGTSGAKSEDYLGDAWYFDATNNRWSELKQNIPGPGKRARHAMVKVEERLYVVGGFRSRKGCLSDCWVGQGMCTAQTMAIYTNGRVYQSIF